MFAFFFDGRNVLYIEAAHVKEGFNSALAKYKEGKAEIAKTTEEIVAE